MQDHTQNLDVITISSAIIYWVNQIGLSEGHPYLLTFYDRKGNPIIDDDTNTVGVDEYPDIRGVDQETD